MKKLMIAMMLILTFSVAFAQTYLINEDFEGTFPPTGWTNNGCIQSINNPRSGTKSLAFNGANDNIIQAVEKAPNLNNNLLSGLSCI